MKKFYTLIAMIALSLGLIQAQTTVDFESLGLAADSYWNGMATTLGTYNTDLETGNATFRNSYTRSDWGYGLSESWAGFAYSKVSNDTTRGYSNQYASISGSGSEASANYGVYYAGLGAQQVSFNENKTLDSMAINNGTYPYYSMLEGDAFSKKFGGEDGNDPDFFLLTIQGLMNEAITGTIEFYLADFRFEDNAQDFIISEWTYVDLSSLGAVNGLQFSLSSSDNGDWGMNTPAYFCIDNLSGINFDDLGFTSGDFWNGSDAALGSHEGSFSEGAATFKNTFTLSDWGYGQTGSFSGWAYSSKTDNSTPGYGNAYSSIAGSGANGSQTYALAYSSFAPVGITLDQAYQATSLQVTNGTYAYFSMLYGDSFAKKFGGSNGNDPDYFLLQIIGKIQGTVTDTVDFYLADFRFEDNAQDYILNTWAEVDLSPLGVVDQVDFILSSSDNGDWGMNTPAYFFIDDLKLMPANSIEENQLSHELKVYPNPTVDYLNIQSDEQIKRIDVLSIQGQTIHTQFPNTTQVQLQIQQLPKSHYIIKTRTKNSTNFTRIIKN